MIPDFEENGNLPPGSYEEKLEAVVKRFGGSVSLKRSVLTKILREFYRYVKFRADEFFVVGSFTSSKLAPKDVDVFVILPEHLSSDLQFRIRLGKFQRDGLIHVIDRYKGLQDKDIMVKRKYFSKDKNQNPRGIILIKGSK